MEENMYDLEMKVHECKKCKENAELSDIVQYFPVYSFGNPEGKEIIVVGVNPSSKEYKPRSKDTLPALSDSLVSDERRQSQLNYNFEYNYFKKIKEFFTNELQTKIGWKKNPWEKVGCLDLVKCPTISPKGGQWSNLRKKVQDTIIRNCEGYLMEQLKLLDKIKIIIPLGVDVCKWFAAYLIDPSTNMKRLGDFKELIFEEREAILPVNNQKTKILFIPQRQGPYSKPEKEYIQKKLLKMLDNT